MIREQRDPGFWLVIASHPDLAGAMMGLDPGQVAALAARPDILPLASENGGYFFAAMDRLGLALELHSLFRPAGWGREAATAGKAALDRVFEGAQLIATHEVEANPRSRPPKSFGFVQAGVWLPTGVGRLRLWVLTRKAWEASPAHRRYSECP